MLFLADGVFTSKLSVPEIIRRAGAEERSPFFTSASLAVTLFLLLTTTSGQTKKPLLIARKRGKQGPHSTYIIVNLFVSKVKKKAPATSKTSERKAGARIRNRTITL